MLSKLWRDPVWSKVIASGLVATLVAAVAYFRGLWPAIGRSFAGGWIWLSGSTSLNNWLLLLLSTCTGIVILLLGVLAWAALGARSDKDSSRSGWRSYTEDTFMGLKWRWGFSSDGEIIHIVPFCARCDYQIRPVIRREYQGDTTTYPCEDCGHSVGPFDDRPSGVESQVARKIQKRIRNDETLPCEA